MRKSLIKRGSPVRHFIIHRGSIRPKTDIHELVFSRVRVKMAQNAIKYVYILQGSSSLLIQNSNVIDFADWLGWQMTRSQRTEKERACDGKPMLLKCWYWLANVRRLNQCDPFFQCGDRFGRQSPVKNNCTERIIRTLLRGKLNCLSNRSRH